MKRFDPEIESLVKKSAGAAGIGEKGGQKLLELFRRAEPSFPDFPERQLDPSLLDEARTRAVTRAPLRRILRWAPVPAMAAAVIAAVFIGIRYYAPPVPSGRIVAAEGSPSLLRGGLRIAGGAGIELRAGDRIATDAASRADAAVENMYRVRVMPKSEIIISGPRISGARRDVGLELLRGSVMVHAWGLGKDDRLTVNAPGSRTVVTGTVFSVTAGPDGAVRYAVYEGSISVSRRVPDDTDPEVSAGIEKIYSDNAVTVLDNQHCDVPVLKREIKTPSEARDVIVRSMPVVVDDAAVPSKDFDEFVAAAGKGSPATVDADFDIQPSGASLYVDGKLRRLSGGKIMLPAGPHDIEVRMDGYETWSGRMNAAPGGSTKIRLSRRTGTDRPLTHEYELGGAAEGMYIGVTRDGALEGMISGRSVWRMPAGKALVARPVLSRGAVVAAFDGGDIVAVSAASGKVLWRRIVPVSKGGPTHVAADGEGIYVAAGSGRLTRLSYSGAVLWKLDVSCQFPIAPVVDRNLVIAALSDGWLLAIDKRKGFRVISIPLNEIPITMAAYRDKVYAIMKSGRAWCYDTGSGEYVWQSGKTRGAVTKMAMDGDNVYFVSSRGEIIMTGHDGKFLWKFDAGEPFRGVPVRDASGIYAIAGRTFCAIDREKGELMRSLVMEQPPTGKISLTGNNILIEMEGGGPTVLKK